MSAHESLKEVQRLFDLGIELGNFIKAAEVIDNEDTENERKQIDVDIETSFQELLSNKYKGDAEELARVLYKYYIKLSVKGINIRQSKLAPERKSGRPSIWGENGEHKLMLYEGVNRELQKMKLEGINSPKILAAIKRMNPYTGNKRAERNAYEALVKGLQSTYSEAKSLLKND